MVVYATVVGSVQILGDHITSIRSMEELRVRIRNAFSFVKQYNSGRRHAGLVEADVWRTLIGNISHLDKDGIPTSPDNSSKTLLRYQKTLPILKDWINGPEDTEAKWLRQLIFSSGKRTSEEYDTWDCAQVILDTIWTLAERRSFGVAAGCAGLFPAMAIAGDEVAVVKGLSVPLVIRRCGGGQAKCPVKHAVFLNCNPRVCLCAWARTARSGSSSPSQTTYPAEDFRVRSLFDDSQLSKMACGALPRQIRQRQSDREKLPRWGNDTPS
ncbi:hypothetical protein B0O99DRAFT_594993 [Bisporella sp. PMI_857]|nr:hypothetical protein B0O99DRAFT_594993 [Bisporella sp. PMI_857]